MNKIVYIANIDLFDEKNLLLLNNILENEDAKFLILGGDHFPHLNKKRIDSFEGLKKVSDFFRDLDIKWTLQFGNNDTLGGLSRRHIFTYFKENNNNFFGDIGPELVTLHDECDIFRRDNYVERIGNFNIVIDKVNLLFLDSGKSDLYGGCASYTPNQVKWFEDKTNNDEKTIIFSHIPPNIFSGVIPQNHCQHSNNGFGKIVHDKDNEFVFVTSHFYNSISSDYRGLKLHNTGIKKYLTIKIDEGKILNFNSKFMD